MANRQNKKINDLAMDVIVFHGKADEIVDNIKKIFDSVGIKCDTVMDFPSMKLNQIEKVEYCIRNCKLPVVVVSFDPDNQNSNKARSNVYDELGKCQTFRRNDFLVLKEELGTKVVDIPTNNIGHFVDIPFNRNELHKLFPRLLSEACSRLNFSYKNAQIRSSAMQAKLDTGDLLSEFLDKMDYLWEEEFDIAADCIEPDDYRSENSFQIKLDKFFQEYWKVFKALIKDKATPIELKSITEKSYRDSVLLTMEVWRDVVDSKVDFLKSKLEKHLRSLKRAKASEIQNLIEEVSKDIKALKRQRETDNTDLIKQYKGFQEKLEIIKVKFK